MIEHLLKWVTDLFEGQKAPVLEVHNDGNTTMFVRKTSLGWDTFSRNNPKADDIQHSLASVESFVRFLNGPLADVQDGGVFVSDNMVAADLAYSARLKRAQELMQDPRQRIAGRDVALPLTASPEFNDLIELTKGVGQKNLWRLLVTTLSTAMDATLLLQIARIHIKAQSESSMDIQVSGLQDDTCQSSVVVTYGDPKAGPQTREIGLDWVWTGRIWTEFDREYPVNLRLEVMATDSGLRFVFHAVDLETARQKARLDLVTHLTSAINPARFTVYDGHDGDE